MFGVKKYSYGDTQMDEKAFREFLYKNNREAYLKYMKNEKLIYTGWGLLAGGLVVGGVFTGLGFGTHMNSDVWAPIMFIGYLGAGVCAAIPMLSVGYHRKNKGIIEMFNAQNSQQPALTLNLQASQNGIGLALNF